MATAQRHPSAALGKQLFQALQANDDFFQLVRLLERLHRLTAAEHGRVGSDCPPAREALRFHAVNQLGFPARALQRLWQDDADSAERYHLAVTFMGLTGPTGVLPNHYTTLIQQRAKHRDHALADFLDLFNHRLIALYYRAWAKYRPAVQHEDYASAEQPAPLTRALEALAGQQPGLQDEVHLYYGGHFSRANRSAASLAQLLTDFLGQPVAIELFIGQWLPIRSADCVVIGQHGRNHRLGDGILLGSRVWDVQSKFRITIGPLPQDVYETLLPGKEEFTQLERLIRQYAPAHLNIELQFVLAADTQPCPTSPRLGRTAWLLGRPEQRRTATIQLR